MRQLKLIPFYTGIKTLEDVFKDRRSLNLLWLEILLNDNIPWESYFNITEVRTAYDKACVWYSHFKTMIESYTGRKPLKIIKRDAIDDREYRKFLEALNFVAT